MKHGTPSMAESTKWKKILWTKRQATSEGQPELNEKKKYRIYGTKITKSKVQVIGM